MSAPLLPPLPGAAVDEAALRAWGRAAGAVLPRPSVITLCGDLGAGKTTLAQALLAGAGVTDDVTSPTYGLVHWFDAPRGPVAHVDLYRLRGPEDLEALGWEDLCRDAALVLVEWPERAGDRLPRPHWALTLHETPDGAARRLEGQWRT